MATNEKRRREGQRAVERMRQWRANGSTHSPAGMEWLGHCAHAVAQAHGRYASIWPTGAKGWYWTNEKYRRTGKKSKMPPRGALVFYSGGSHGYGHVGVSNGRGKVWQVDIDQPGRIGIADVMEPVRKWGLHYLGWIWADEVASW